MKNEYVFFLGGHDAEMMTIKELLTENKVPEENILDKNLKWL